MTAIHFDRRFAALMKVVVHGPTKPLGEVKDWFVRCEFQNRGSPHYHIFFWCSGVPNEINENTREIILQYISDTIYTHIQSATEDPDMNYLVKKLQTHSYSNYVHDLQRDHVGLVFPNGLVQQLSHLLDLWPLRIEISFIKHLDQMTVHLLMHITLKY